MKSYGASGDEPSFSSPPPHYLRDTRTSIRYLPVTWRGKAIGYLWASTSEYAAEYIRCLEAQMDALRRWIGEPEDGKVGGIAADVEVRDAPSVAALKEIADR